MLNQNASLKINRFNRYIVECKFFEGVKGDSGIEVLIDT